MGISSKDVNSAVENLVVKLRRRLITGSYCSAMETLKVMRLVISNGRWNTVADLITLIKSHGKRLISAQPIELAVGNVIRKVLHMIREDYIALVQEEPSIPRERKPQFFTGSSLYDLLADRTSSKVDYTLLHTHDPSSPLKPVFIQAIKEMMDEFDNLYNNNIFTQSILCDNDCDKSEIIMTIGKSRTVEEFLKTAHRKRKFQVIVAECAPLYTGQDLALSLSQAGIEATLISDSAIYAVMSRVNKVILGTHAVLANGGLIAQSGSHMVAASARYHHIPVVVCTGLYKLSPLQPYDEDMFNLCVGPDPILRFEDEYMENVDLVNPFFDYVAPEFVNLYVTNSGGHPPSYIYRLLSENYHHEDLRLDSELPELGPESDSRPSTSDSVTSTSARTQRENSITLEVIDESENDSS